MIGKCAGRIQPCLGRRSASRHLFRKRGRGRTVLITVAIWLGVAGLAMLFLSHRDDIVAAVRAVPKIFSPAAPDKPLHVEPAAIPGDLSQRIVNAMRNRWANVPDDATIVFYDRRDAPMQGNIPTIFVVGAVSAPGEGWVFAYDVAANAIVETERHLTVRSHEEMRVFNLVASERGHVPTRIARTREGRCLVEFYDGWDGGCGHSSSCEYEILPETLDLVDVLSESCEHCRGGHQDCQRCRTIVIE